MSRRSSTIISVVTVAVVAVLLAVMCRAFVAEMFIAAPQQMEKTLLPGDRVIVEKWHYGLRTASSHLPASVIDRLCDEDIAQATSPYLYLWTQPVRCNDIIVYNYPIEDEGSLSHHPIVIARCVGVPGDTITAQDGCVRVNGNLLVESPVITDPYLAPDTLMPVIEEAMLRQCATACSYELIGNQALCFIDRYSYDKLKECLPSAQLPQLVTLSHDNYYVELPPYGCDAVITSHNAKMYADIINRYEPCKVELHGNALYRGGRKIKSYRFSQPYYWVLCDNRTATTDSRTFGVLPHTHVVGRYGMTLFSIDADKRGADSWRINRFFQRSK